MHFQNYKLQKEWIDEGLQSLVSEHRLTVNMLKCPEVYWNLEKWKQYYRDFFSKVNMKN